jgi:hypothetical protein
MNSPKAFRAWTLVAAGALVLTLGACDGKSGGKSSASGPAASPSASVSTEDSKRAWLDVAKCMREHGFPTFPDPVQDARGIWYISTDLGDGTDSPPACDHAIRAAKEANHLLSVLPAEQMAKLRTYAKCIREHGVPGFPDPDDEGNFDLPQGMNDDAQLRDAQVACKQYAPPPRPK